MAARKLLVAKASFACSLDGVEVLIPAGKIVAADHSLAKSHALMFEPVEPLPDVEQATAAPGEKRGRRRS
jgi:hypothetical protein